MYLVILELPVPWEPEELLGLVSWPCKPILRHFKEMFRVRLPKQLHQLLLLVPLLTSWLDGLQLCLL